MGTIFSLVYVIDQEVVEQYPAVLTAQKLRNGMSAEVFLYDTIASDATRQMCSRFSREDITYIEKAGWDIWQCYQDALPRCTGIYVNFAKISTDYGCNELNAVISAFDNCQTSVVTLHPIMEVGSRIKDIYPHITSATALKTQENPFIQPPSFHAIFMKRDILRDFGFGVAASLDRDMFCVMELLDKVQEFCALPDICRLWEFTRWDAYNYKWMYEKDWYTKELREIYLPYIQEHHSKVSQAGILLLLENKLLVNSNDRDKTLLRNEEIQEYWNCMGEILQYIDDDIITHVHYKRERFLPRHVSPHFLRIKYGCDKLPVTVKENPCIAARDKRCVFLGETAVEPFHRFRTRILAINNNGDRLTFDAALVNMDFADTDELQVFMRVGKQRIPAEFTGIYNHSKYFGKTVQIWKVFQVSVPKELYQNKTVHCQIEVDYHGETVNPLCEMTKLSGRLITKLQLSYWDFGDGILQYDHVKKQFVIQKRTTPKLIKNEAMFLLWMVKTSTEKAQNLMPIVWLRIMYWLTKPFYKRKKVWVTFDQLFKGGDNGEYFFRYMNEEHREIGTYYILNDTAPEYKELYKRYGRRVLPFGSMRARLVSLQADIIFDTRANVGVYSGFDEYYEPYIRNLYNGEVTCLQHGLTIQDIARYQNRLFDNIRYYFCVSPYEIQNINRPIYGYTDEELSLTGAPRYDGLIGAAHKQILISPTWRRNVTAGSNVKGHENEYSVNFKHTPYFRIYNSLINDEKLIACAKETGYKLVYLIHPILSPQVDDFEANEYVSIQAGTEVNYEQILKESSLLLTDFSGIQFDFAYMRRPLLYYHPKELPAQYAAAGLNYDTMGFGPVCKTHEEIVENLCRFMKNECRLEDMYLQRINDFFPYNDQNNCARVYESALKFWEKRVESRT